MSASRPLSRCVVVLETTEAGAEHRIDAATERVEVLFDELEQGGRQFVNPRSAQFTKPQLGLHQQGHETCRVEVVCAPPLTADELRSLATRVSRLLSELPDVTPREVRAVERAASEADTDPGEPRTDEAEVATREHVAKTRPEGVKRRPIPVEGADEVTDPQAEVPTRPEGVISVRRR